MRFKAFLLPIVLPATFLAAQQRAVAVPPRLVIAIAVDQFRPDYLDRWQGQFTGGLAFLLREGVFFPHGEQDHAITETAPGHSTMMSGRSPASTGIVSNDLGVPDSTMPLIGSTAVGASPRRFIGTTLLDWILARDPNTRSLSVSRKDRGAILPMGRSIAPVYWFSQGKFTTSRYYADTLPTWVRRWNARDFADKLKGTNWALTHPGSFYTEVDDRPFEAGGTDRVFPHSLPPDSTRTANRIIDFSVMDSLTLDFALAGLRTLALGQRDGTDFLSISLSSTDAVGHKWGPGSLEIHEHVLNVDRWLGTFFDSLSRIVPLDRVVISLTADHGSTEFPEAGQGGRLDLAPQVRALNAWRKARGDTAFRALDDGGLIFGNGRLAGLTAREMDSVSTALAAELARLPGVRKVFTPATLAKAKSSDIDAMRWRHTVPPGFKWLVAVCVEEHWVFGAGKTSTGHGTINADDVQVPLLFRIPGVPAARVERTVRTIDIAPTLAAILGIKPLEKIEGVALPEVVRHAPRR